MSKSLRAAITAAIAALAVITMNTYPKPAGATVTELQPVTELQRVAIIGDSLTVGYGVPNGQGYADRLEAAAPGDNVLPLAHTVPPCCGG